MERSPSWKANRSAASLYIPRIWWNRKVHYCIHKSPPTVPVSARSIYSMLPHPASWRAILILPSHLRLGLPSGLRFPHQNHLCTSSLPTNTTYPGHNIHLHLFTRIISGEECKPWSSSLCSLSHSPLTSSLLGPNIFLSTLFP